MRKIAILGLIGIAATAWTASAQAAVGIACANTDISPTATDCSGFVLNNAINGSPKASLTSGSLLAELGYTGSLAGLETITELKSATLINFKRLLIGRTIIGVHYGNGQGSPGRPIGSAGDGGDTAFYLFDAGSGLDTFTLKYNSSSVVRLYQTGVPAVPEPGTWALMLIGIGGMGMALRRRRSNVTGIVQLA